MDDFFGAFALPYVSPGYLNCICARLFDFNHWTISTFEKKNYTTISDQKCTNSFILLIIFKHSTDVTEGVARSSRSQIPITHAITGCDSVSPFTGRGKRSTCSVNLLAAGMLLACLGTHFLPQILYRECVRSLCVSFTVEKMVTVLMNCATNCSARVQQTAHIFHLLKMNCVCMLHVQTIRLLYGSDLATENRRSITRRSWMEDYWYRRSKNNRRRLDETAANSISGLGAAELWLQRKLQHYAMLVALRARTCVTAVRPAKIQFQDRMWNKGRTTVNTTMKKVMTKTICCS